MRKLLFLLGSMLLFIGSVLSQDKVIKGKVTDDVGNGLPNVTVSVKGTSIGTTTKSDGSFSLTAPSSAKSLVFSSVGMAAVEVSIGNKETIDVTLKPTEKAMEEVVVVGYGVQKRKEVTGNVSQIAAGKIKDVPVQSFDQALSGRAPGVNISIPNGVLGNPPVIRIRGVNSINLSSFPLVVIDGVPSFSGDIGGTASNNVLSSLNPSDIESVEILKDAAASAIYGSRAAAGVLLITTKKGKQGKARVNYDAWAGWTKAYGLIDVLNAEEYTMIKNEGLTNAGTPPNGTTRGFYTMNDANGKLVDTRWYDWVYRTGFAQNHNISVSGANEKTNYYLSANWTDQEGMLVNNDFQRKTGRFTLDHKVNTWLSLGGSFNYSNTENNGLNTGSTGGAFNTSGVGRLPLVLAPNVGPYKNDGTYNINAAANTIGQGNNLTALSFTNPVMLNDLNKFSSESDQIRGNINAQIKLPIGVLFRTQYGIDYVMFENKEFRTGQHGDGVQFGGAAQNIFGRFKRWVWQNTLQYDKTIARNHNLGLLVGTEQQYTTISSWGADRRTAADPFYDEYQGSFTGIVPAGNSLSENYLLSYFGRVTYDFKKKYYFSVNARRDGYSAFADKWGNFGGASAGWIVSEEDFFKNSSISNTLSTLKFRGSYGEVGNFQGIGDYAFYSFFSPGLYGADPSLFFSQSGNTSLTWETSKKTDVGLAFGLLNDRITGEFTWYKNNIDGLILNDPQSPSRGIPGNVILSNIGSMYNMGIEFNVTANVISSKDFTWSTNFNYTTQKNKVTALATGNADILVATGGLESPSIIRVGESIGSFYVIRTEGVNPANGRRVAVLNDGTRVQYAHPNNWTKVSDGTASRAPSQVTDGVVMGPALPKWYGGWDNNIRYKGFDVNVLVYYCGGNYVYNGTKAGLRDNRNWNNSTEVLTRWQKPGDITNIPRYVFGDNISNGSGLVLSENVEKGDFVKIRNISVGYTLPTHITNRISLSNVRVYVAALNPFTFTNYSGFDPEISSNGNSTGSPSVDRNSVPLARTINFGLNVGF